MRHDSFSLTWDVAALILIVLAVLSCLALANPSDSDAAFESLQQPQEFSWSATHGDGEEPTPASESSYTDYNPSCNHSQIAAVYRPMVSPLVCFEPFAALPKVFPERFVPPQNSTNQGFSS